MTADPFGPAHLLEIPAFLRRTPKARKWATPLRPKWRRFTIHVNGDLPVIGSGCRIVDVFIGRKWVRVRALGVDHGMRVSVPVWDKIKKREEIVA